MPYIELNFIIMKLNQLIPTMKVIVNNIEENLLIVYPFGANGGLIKNIVTVHRLNIDINRNSDQFKTITCELINK